ncbi:hypothetical protein BDQ17DRAFT_1392357 [Cyathus striatus]|nr:hypothetical protein BDQ17DRAFT_1392357 [Cyathus striatus]
MNLHTLPYDLLFNISTYLDAYDIHALHLTCKALHFFSTSRPVYRKLARDLIWRCRALPLKGFQRVGDLTTEQLIRAVNRALRYEVPGDTVHPSPCGLGTQTWYKVVSAPPGEEVDWLSPITRVVCWDVQTDSPLAEWCPESSNDDSSDSVNKWELWKCRVEFEERAVYFTIAKLIVPRYDETRVMSFVLMKLTFFDGPTGEPSPKPPVFSRVTDFMTSGIVMNVFLLDPATRLLSAFVWISGLNNIGLYVLPDWEKDRYVFVDTGIECVCAFLSYLIEHCIHCEEADAVYQHFYPLSLLSKYTQTLENRARDLELASSCLHGDHIEKVCIPYDTESRSCACCSYRYQWGYSNYCTCCSASASGGAYPFPFPPWYPETAHFVRQWWPSIPGITKVSCTVILLAAHDQATHRTQYVLAQHYFRGKDEPDDSLMHMWYVSTPFEVVRVFLDSDDLDEDTATERPRPLVAVDFGHAVWIEYLDSTQDDTAVDADVNGVHSPTSPASPTGSDIFNADNDDDNLVEHVLQTTDSEPKALRFVTFPGSLIAKPMMDREARRWLIVPEELDLGAVETINLDQSQGAVILSDHNGKIFILCYE